MRKRKIAIIGHFADGKDFFDGQTVSTRLLRDELAKSKCFKKVCEIDTYNYKKRFVKIFFSWFVSLFSCSYVIIMLSGDGLKKFCPMIYYANKIFRRKVFHRVIGGELDLYLMRNKECIKYMNSFEANWVQSNKLVEKLNAIGLTNAEYLENFRDIKPISISEEQNVAFEKPFKFCTFSRVSESKGIGLAIKSISRVNEMLGAGTAVLHIYGPVEDKYSEAFYKLLDEHSNCAEYRGSVPSNQAVSVLKDYYMHLFPTTWSGEGFPGTLIDCYNAALPTIASDWAYNAEFIVDGVNGYLYDWQKPTQLSDKITEAIKNSEKIWSMKKSCLSEAEKYKSDVVMAKIVNKILS